MGNRYIDAVWLIPVILFVGWTWLVYRLGIETGRDQIRQQIRAARKRVVRQRTVAGLPVNVVPIRKTN